MITKYKLFENIQQAKNFLKKRGSAELGRDLTKEEESEIENDKNFQEIKKILKDAPGYVYIFTKFFYTEEISIEELKNLYELLKDIKTYSNSLPVNKRLKPIDSYQKSEDLFDDIEQIRRYRTAKKWIDRFSSAKRIHSDRTVNIKNEFDSATEPIKKKVEAIAMAFEELGKDSENVIDPKKNKSLQDLFFKSSSRYLSLNDAINGANDFIKAENNSSVSKFFLQIEEVNKVFGELNGADIVYNQNGILILEIRSFQANNKLNSNTSHCIARTISYWNSYVGGDDKYTRQYYIYNFNLSPADNKSVIGITIDSDGRVSACHTKDDGEYSGKIKAYMSGLKIPFNILAPMSSKEKEAKRKRVAANREIIKSRATIDNIKKALSDGADPNANDGKPLTNAIDEGNVEKVKFLINQGASPNIGEPLKNCKDIKFNVLNVLLDNGAEMSTEVIKNYSLDIDAMKNFVKRGIDVDGGDLVGYPIRSAIDSNKLELAKFLLDNGCDLSQRNYMTLVSSVKKGTIDGVKLLYSNLNSVKDMSVDNIRSVVGRILSDEDVKSLYPKVSIAFELLKKNVPAFNQYIKNSKILSDILSVFPKKESKELIDILTK